MKKINKFFKNSKELPIDKFFENVLYDNKDGYYAKKNPIGKNADFITSPLVSFIFSEMISIWIIDLWEKLNKPKNFNIIELGPGNGQMCKVMLSSFKRFPIFYKSANIFLYEKSKILKKMQKKIIGQDKVRWIDNISDAGNGPTIFIGNEFFDALPIKQYKKEKENLFEKFVKLNKNFEIKFFFKKVSTTTINKFNKFKSLRNLNFIEFPSIGFLFIKQIIDKINKNGGGILLIDYGYKKSTNIDTIQSIKNHKKNHILENIGDADVTSLVNFELMEEFFKINKLNVCNVVSQSFFLKKLGIIERAMILTKNMNFKDKSNFYSRLKRLLSSDEMGELFKVIFASKLKVKNIIGFN